jgi:hypothetical protein
MVRNRRLGRLVAPLIVAGVAAVSTAGCVLVPAPEPVVVAPRPPVVVVPVPAYGYGHYGWRRW